MTTYIIGDVHGCFRTLMHLMEQLSYTPSRDELFFVGDLVNNGPGSAEVMRFAQRHDAHVTLGNHDLHLLAVLYGASAPRKKDTFHDVIDAPDMHDLRDWLRAQHLFLKHERFWMVHAGLLPDWSVDELLAIASQIEGELRGAQPGTFLEAMYGNEPAQWCDAHTKEERMRIGVNAMTRMRALHRHDGSMEFHYKGTLDTMPAGLLPWFMMPHSRQEQPLLCFGHWSALGLHHHGEVVCLDSGCTWGERLTAFRLDDHTMHSVPTHADEAARSH